MSTAPEPETDPPAGPVAGIAPDPRVVIVDDTVDLRDLLRLALQRGGFEVVGEAGDGASGIDVVEAVRPDLVILDLAMPVMDGIEALPAIRRAVPTATIVVLSGFGAHQMAERALVAGADGYVQKGAPLATVLEHLRRLLGRPREASPALSAVPTASEPPTPSSRDGYDEGVDQAGGSDAELRTRASPEEALRLAPYAVLELVDAPPLRIVYANEAARRLLHGGHADGVGDRETGQQGRPGQSEEPLPLLTPELASLVALHRLDPEASFEVDLAGHQARATVRRTDSSLLVYLDDAPDDDGLLRRAIATTAHEVRGPVAVLCGIAEVLAGGEEVDGKAVARLMASVARQARILDRLTADLLTAAQIQRGTLRVELQSVDPRGIVEGILDNYPTVDLHVEDPRTVLADPLRLEQMVTNLLSNAHKYGVPPITVRVRPDGDDVRIEVVDAGSGVPPDFAEHLFREFSRAGQAVATGTGLGLYVVRTLARAQGGEVDYHRSAEGETVFAVRLRASRDAPTAHLGGVS